MSTDPKPTASRKVAVSRSTQRSTGLVWRHIVSVAAVIGALATVVILLFGDSLLVGGQGQGPTSSGAAATAPSTRLDATGGSDSPHSLTDDCVDTQGGATHCNTPGAGVILAAANCTVDGARAALGVPADLRIDITTRRVAPAAATPPKNSTVCVAFPGSLAVAYEGTAAQIRDLPDTLPRRKLPSALVLCASDSGADVSCAAPHYIEPVTPWTADDGVNHVDACTKSARTYTVRPLALSDTLSAEVQRGTREGRPVFRCAVRSSVLLTGTVYRLEGGELPKNAGH